MTEANKEVFAWYGLAAAQAQVLESVLAGLVFLLSVTPEDGYAQRDAWDKLSRTGLGALLHLTLSRGSAPANDIFEELRILRNDLVHHWFRDVERLARLETSEGRRTLVDELITVADRFGAASLLVSAVTLFISLAQALSKSRSSASPSDRNPGRTTR
jgi:hypothetical protein